jgi:hypothetical protein
LSTWIKSAGLATCVWLVAVGVLAQTKNAYTVKNVSVQPVTCACNQKGKHGNIDVVYSDGKKARIVKTGNAMDARLSPDHKSIVWIEGHDGDYKNEPWFYEDRLVVYKDGRRAKIIHPAKLIEDWQFREGGKKIAVSSAGMHGPSFLELFDTNTGRLLSKCNGYDEKKPSWAKGLDSR